MKILLIDDDLQTLEMLKNALFVNGYECEAFDDPYLAVQNYSAYDFDVVLCDFVMPNLNGMEVLKIIKELNENCIFILYSAYLDKNTIKNIFDAGATDVLYKPMDWTAFIDLLKFYEMELA